MGIPLLEEVYCFFGFRFLGFLVSWIWGFLVCWFVGLLVSKFLGFKISWFPGFETSKIQRFNDPILPDFHVVFFIHVDFTSTIFKILLIGRFVGICRRPPFSNKNQHMGFPTF